MIKLYGSTREVSLRILLLLSVVDRPVDEVYIATADYMATYGECFEITEDNLNGNNPYKSSEYPVRNKIVEIALKDLVLKGLVTPIYDHEGYNYHISEPGSSCGKRLTSRYSKLYLSAVSNAIGLIEKSGLDEAIIECERIYQYQQLRQR